MFFLVFILQRVGVLHCCISNDLKYSNSANRIRILLSFAFEYSTTALHRRRRGVQVFHMASDKEPRDSHSLLVAVRHRTSPSAPMIISRRQHGVRSARLGRKLIALRPRRRNPAGASEKLRGSARLRMVPLSVRFNPCATEPGRQ